MTDERENIDGQAALPAYGASASVGSGAQSTGAVLARLKAVSKEALQYPEPGDVVVHDLSAGQDIAGVTLSGEFGAGCLLLRPRDITLQGAVQISAGGRPRRRTQ